MKKTIPIFILSLLLFNTGIINTAYALSYDFYCITNQDYNDIGGQILMDVTASGTNKAWFTFSNLGSAEDPYFSVTDIYFDDNNSSINFASYVLEYFTYELSFDKNATPPDLPGGEDIPVPFNADYSFDSDPNVVKNGINPGESMGILFELNGGASLATITNDLRSKDLRIGLHVQCLDLDPDLPDDSAGFINNPRPVPEPATIFLLGTGLAGIAGLMRKKQYGQEIS